MSKQIPKTLYHYCSLSTFQKIIESNSIWLSDISQSNDSYEMKWLYNEFLSFFTKVENEYLKKHLKLLEKIANMRNAGVSDDDLPSEPIYDSKHTDEIRDVISLLKRAQIFQSFVFCLSELSDSLSQWRGYADDGYGIAIGFKAKYFNLFNNFIGTSLEDSFCFDKISYGTVQAEMYFNSVSGFDKITEMSTSNDILNIGNRAINIISKKAAYFKNSSFEEEKEWRVSITLPNFDVKQEYFKLQKIEEQFEGKYLINSFGFISTRDRLVPHIELNVPKMKDAIQEIYIGPKSNVSIRDMELFLVANGLLSSSKDDSITIKYSASSYR